MAAPAVETEISTQSPKKDYWLPWRLPLLAIALVATVVVMLFNLPTPLKINFTDQNIEKYHQSGFFGAETDGLGNQYRWTNGFGSLLVDLKTRYPVTLTLSIRNAAVVNGPTYPTVIKANGVEVGTLEPKVYGADFFT